MEWDEHGNPIEGPQEWDEHGNPVRQRQQGLMSEIEGAMSSFNRGIPFSSEITSAAAAIGAGLQGQDPREAFRNQTQRTQEASRDFRTRRPNVAALAEGTGMAAPILMTGGAAAPELAGARVGGMLTQIPRAATIGGAYGYAYGAGGQDQAGAPLQERVDAGNQGAAFGAALGAATPPAVSLTRSLVAPAYSLARRTAERFIPTPAPNTLGANGANLRAVPPASPPRGPQIPREAIRTVERLRDRSGQSVDQLESRFQRIQRNPQGEVLADAFDTPGVHTLRPIAQSPGRSGQRATETARHRIRDASRRINDALNRGLGVGESRAAALNRLEGSYRDLSATEYAHHWTRRMTAEERALFDERVRPWLQSENPELRRIMTRAMRGAERQFNLDRANGRVSGAIDDHLGRYAHYIKMELGELARFEASPLRGASGNRIGGLRQLYRQFGDLLDPGNGQPAIIPGYRDTTARAGDYFSAREALDMGEQWLSMGPEEVAAARAAMSEFELHHARIGLADAIRHSTRGNVVGNRNVANALDDPTMQEAVAAAFDDPAQAAQFLSTVNTQNELARNAIAWGGGSPSWANAMYGADEAAHGMAEMAGHVAGGNPAGAVARGGRMALNVATLGHIERMNNARGEALLTRIDQGDDARAFTQAVIAELRRIEATARSNARISRTGAAASGAQQGRRRQ